MRYSASRNDGTSPGGVSNKVASIAAAFDLADSAATSVTDTDIKAVKSVEREAPEALMSSSVAFNRC